MPHDTVCAEHFRNHKLRITQLLPLQSAAARVILHPASCILPKPQFRTAQPMSMAVRSAHSPFSRRRQLNLPIYLNVLHFLQLKLYNMLFAKTLKPSKRPRVTVLVTSGIESMSADMHATKLCAAALYETGSLSISGASLDCCPSSTRVLKLHHSAFTFQQVTGTVRTSEGFHHAITLFPGYDTCS